MKPLKYPIGILVLLLMVSQPGFATTVKEVTSQLICTCGCDTMIVSDCNCGTADDIRALVQGKIDQGMGKNSILNEFVAQYGEKVLAAPTKSGFNLTAWILPFVVLFAAIATVTFVVRAWVRGSQGLRPSVVTVLTERDAQVRERLRRELEQFDA